ncbi:unnamed protein product [Arabidopsis halleri]
MGIPNPCRKKLHHHLRIHLQFQSCNALLPSYVESVVYSP